MTGEEMRTARKQLGLTQNGLAALLGVSDGRVVRRWEGGERDVPGPVVVLLGAIMASRAVRRHFRLKFTA